MHSCGTRRAVGLIFLLIGGPTAVLRAQQRLGEIRLEIKDPSGAAMEASGKLRNLASGGERTFQTDAQGMYTFGNLPYGRYSLEVSKIGFATQSVEVDLQSGTISRTVQLAVRSQATLVHVVAVTPLPGADLSGDQIPTPVQTATSKDLENSGGLDLADFMNRRLNGVYVNENQENPYQPDINHRNKKRAVVVVRRRAWTNPSQMDSSRASTRLPYSL